jgi:hypothetical protein
MSRGSFSSSYVEAREKFLAAAGSCGATIRSHQAPGRGPQGEALHMDIAVIGDPAAAKRLVISSGLHGVEGFCGSACQAGLMRSGATVASLPENIALVLVHALNPFGFAWVRRFNEDNVDLNRNFLEDFSDPPANGLYNGVHEALAASPIDAAVWAASREALARFRETRGETDYLEAVTGGQYTHPHGLFYGGAAPCWTNLTYVAALRDLLAGAAVAVLFDIHTGIGAYGERVAFCQTREDDPRKAVAERLLAETVRTPARSSRGARARRGLMLPYVDGLKLAPFVLPLGVEFGTYPLVQTIEAIRAENWLFHHGERSSAAGRRIVAALREAFCPTDADWEVMVRQKSAEMFRTLLAGLRELQPV